jgi:hypothetical protein
MNPACSRHPERTIFWPYERGRWPYDAMVIAIMLFWGGLGQCLSHNLRVLLERSTGRLGHPPNWLRATLDRLEAQRGAFALGGSARSDGKQG